MNWHVTADSMIDRATGREYVLRKHGLSVHEVRNVRPGARIVLGFIPDTTEITGDAKALREALAQLSIAGDHFTYFASEYRAGAETVVLLDYIRGSSAATHTPVTSRELQDN
jgi:hypothetical protein